MSAKGRGEGEIYTVSRYHNGERRLLMIMPHLISSHLSFISPSSLAHRLYHTVCTLQCVHYCASKDEYTNSTQYVQYSTEYTGTVHTLSSHPSTIGTPRPGVSQGSAYLKRASLAPLCQSPCSKCTRHGCYGFGRCRRRSGECVFVQVVVGVAPARGRRLEDLYTWCSRVRCGRASWSVDRTERRTERRIFGEEIGYAERR